MSFRLRILPQAMRDLMAAVDWLRDRSERAADRLVEAFEKAAAAIEEDPNRFPLAWESEDHPVELRQCLFGTPQGRKHRIVFAKVGREIRIVHVRGPGQDRIDPAHIRYE